MTNQINLKNVNLYLIGMVGVGNTPIGQRIAQQLGYQFFDTDTLITQLAQTSIEDLITQKGEQTLRTLESQVLAQISAYTRLVVATGEGIVLASTNWSHLQQGLVVWLDLPVQALWEQMQAAGTQTTVLSLPALEQRMQERRHLYAQADVHIVMNADWTPEIVVDQIYSGVAKVIKPEVSSKRE